MRKGFSILEIILAIIFIGMISEIILGVSEAMKSGTNININTNNHILLESEIEQAKASCCMLGKLTCSDIGGVGDNINCKIEYQTSGLTYFDKNNNIIENKYNLVESNCSKINNKDGFYEIETKIKNKFIVDDFFKGDSIVNKCY